MAHQQRGRKRGLILLILLTLTLIPQSGAQIASTASTSCVTLRDTATATSFQQMLLGINAPVTPPSSSCDGPAGFITIPAGSSFTIHCQQMSNGVGVLAPDALNIYLVEDDTNFPVGPGAPASPVRTIAANTCIGTTTTFTAACTTNGQAGGSPAYGLFRLLARQQRTVVGTTYDVTSDNAGTTGTGNTLLAEWGLIRCELGVTALGESNPQTVYVAGDTIGTTITGNATPLDAANNGNFWLTCGTVSYNLGNSFPTTSAKSATATIIGSLALWQDDCPSITFGYQFTKFSTLSGWTSTRLAIYNGTPPSGVTFNAGKDNATFTSSKTLDRTIAPGVSPLCDYHVNATVAAASAFNRLEGVRSVCTDGWVNARGVSLGNNAPVRGFLVTGTAWLDTSNYPSVDFSTTAGGDTEFTSTSSITATVGTYKTQLQQFSTTARTEAVLLGIGNSTGTFTLSATRTFSGVILHPFRNFPNQSSFVSGNDQLFFTVQNLSNVRGELLSGVSVLCHRVFPGGAAEADFDDGLTNASGDTADYELPVVPPTGAYNIVCTSTAAGNTATYTVTYFIVSPFTADVSMLIAYKLRPGGKLTLTAGINTVDGETGIITLNPPDDPNDFHYVLIARACDGCAPYEISRGLLQQDAYGLFRANVTLPNNQTNESYLIATAYANFTGRLFLSTRQAIIDQLGNFTGNFTGNATGNFTGNVTIPQDGTVDGMIGFDLSNSPFVGDLTIADVLLVLLWLAAFLWSANRLYYICAAVSFAGILQPLYVSGFTIGTVVILGLWCMFLFLYIVLEWRDNARGNKTPRNVRP